MTQENPLQKYYRQPSIYITLPSAGKYYGAEVYSATATGEIPVLPMTAKDELAFKTPDAMISGQATVDVIKSCVPNILDPWQLVNYDLDLVLLAIRIASYGENMDITAIVPLINESVTHSVNLPAMLDTIKNIKINDVAKTTSGFEVTFKPLTYREMTRSQTLAFEQQKTYAAVSASQLSDEEKNQRFAETFKKLTDLNFQMLHEGITQIKSPDGAEVTDRAQIIDFLANTDAKTVVEIQDELAKIRNQATFKPLKLKSSEEQIKKGAPVSFDVPVTFDNSNFFG
jgi:hypothetical protein